MFYFCWIVSLATRGELSDLVGTMVWLFCCCLQRLNVADELLFMPLGSVILHSLQGIISERSAVWILCNIRAGNIVIILYSIMSMNLWFSLPLGLGNFIYLWLMIMWSYPYKKEALLWEYSIITCEYVILSIERKLAICFWNEYSMMTSSKECRFIVCSWFLLGSGRIF